MSEALINWFMVTLGGKVGLEFLFLEQERGQDH